MVTVFKLTVSPFFCEKTLPIRSELISGCQWGCFAAYSCMNCIFRLVCRPDQLKTNCSCPLECGVPPNASCTSETCQPGCSCPFGTYNNGTHCVPKEQCFCYFNGTKYLVSTGLLQNLVFTKTNASAHFVTKLSGANLSANLIR